MKAIPLFIVLVILLGAIFQVVPDADASPCVRTVGVCDAK